MEKLISGCARDVYIALLYFDACIFQEELGNATFLLEKEEFAHKLKQAIKCHEGELLDRIKFSNGLTESDPWSYIEYCNKEYMGKFGFSII